MRIRLLYLPLMMLALANPVFAAGERPTASSQEGRVVMEPVAADEAAEAPEFLLFITSDGFVSEYVEWYSPPNILELIEGGTRVLDARPVFPTNTTPNMASLMTGAYPKTTGVANNNQYDRGLDRIVGGVRPQIKTIGHMLQDAGWTTSAISHFVLETRGVDDDLYFTMPTYEVDTAAPGEIAKKATELIRERRAQFLAINFGMTDTVGHRNGPHSDEIEAMVLAVDAAIGEILGALKEEGLYEKTLITVNADHGMSEHADKQASMEPAEALRQAGFSVATNQGELEEDTEIVVITGGVRLVYFRKELSEEQMATAMAALEAIEGAEIMGRERLDELHCHPELSGDLIIHPLPGYTMSHAGNPGGLHGRLTEADPILLFHGPGIRRGATVERAENVDIVPTLLHLVGVPPAETVDGTVITGALAN